MEPVKRMAVGGAWDRLPEEIVSLITVKVTKTSEASLKDLRNLWLTPTHCGIQSGEDVADSP
jgi:hypothetical protein